MCLWLLTACLGLLPAKSPTNVIVVGVPAPIVLPTAAPTTLPNASISFPPVTIPTITLPTATIPTVTFPTGTFPTGTLPPITIPTIAPSTGTTNTVRQVTTGEVLLPVILCNNSDVVCVANPDDDAGPLPIDPRLGTTPRTPAALQVPPITGYSAQIPNYDMSVRFPRQKRSLEVKLMDLFSGTNKIAGNHRISKRQSCTCVPTGTCNRSGTNAGAGLIDIRIVTPGGGGTGQCPAGQEYCCTGTTQSIACGTLQTVPALAVTPQAGQANYGEFPWQALILTRQNDYLAGGVLINQQNVLTVTHRLVNYVVSGTAPNVKVRLGEWDAAGTYEPVPFQEYTVTRVFSHPSYNPNTLQYGIMILRLSALVPLSPSVGSAPTINRACLPPSAASTYVGQRCWVSGWGKNMFGVNGQYQQILKKVDVPIVASATCQSQMQIARLGASFVLDTTSFICAGGEANKDSCTGDGGSGLVCQVNGQWVVVGLVSWGLGCANANVPAAYVNIAGLLPWIQQQLATV